MVRLPASPRFPKRQAIEDYLTHVIAPSLPILPYDERAAKWHAAERARLKPALSAVEGRAGKTPSFADGQIAAIARTQELILVTFNRADYAGFQDLTIEDWR